MVRNRKTPLGVFFLPALLLWAFAAHAADTPMTTITIQVTTQAGRPVEQAEVVVNFVKGRWIGKIGKNVRTSYDLRTNQEGLAKIPSIPQGNIRIMVSAKGYQTYGQTMEIKEEEKTIEITLNPPQPQYSAH
ncbi:MAG: carboxypeptidase-like regulatory domain-containing protein [Bryobacteraceae bacterium]|jgi:hypothetical protein